MIGAIRRPATRPSRLTARKLMRRSNPRNLSRVPRPLEISRSLRENPRYETGQTGNHLIMWDDRPASDSLVETAGVNVVPCAPQCKQTTGVLHARNTPAAGHRPADPARPL